MQISMGDGYGTNTLYHTAITAWADDPFLIVPLGTIFSGVILITSNNALIGDSVLQSFPLNEGDSISVSNIDLGRLYFKNATAGSNITIEVIGGTIE